MESEFVCDVTSLQVGSVSVCCLLCLGNVLHFGLAVL